MKTQKITKPCTFGDLVLAVDSYSKTRDEAILAVADLLQSRVCRFGRRIKVKIV